MTSKKKYKRKSIRLHNFDYSSEGLYFVTLCTIDGLHLFGRIKNGEMILNTFGRIAAEEWIKTPTIRKNTSLGAFIIMPNHLHGIIKIDYKIDSKQERTGKFISPSNSLGAIIRGYKGSTTKKIRQLIREEKLIKGGNASEWLFTPGTGELQFAPTEFAPADAPFRSFPAGKGSIWQRNYYEHIIRNQKAYTNISNYIQNNPLNWEKDKFKNS